MTTPLRPIAPVTPTEPMTAGREPAVETPREDVPMTFLQTYIRLVHTEGNEQFVKMLRLSLTSRFMDTASESERGDDNAILRDIEVITRIGTRFTVTQREENRMESNTFTIVSIDARDDTITAEQSRIIMRTDVQGRVTSRSETFTERYHSQQILREYRRRDTTRETLGRRLSRRPISLDTDESTTFVQMMRRTGISE